MTGVLFTQFLFLSCCHFSETRVTIAIRASPAGFGLRALGLGLDPSPSLLMGTGAIDAVRNHGAVRHGRPVSASSTGRRRHRRRDARRCCRDQSKHGSQGQCREEPVRLLARCDRSLGRHFLWLLLHLQREEARSFCGRYHEGNCRLFCLCV